MVLRVGREKGRDVDGPGGDSTSRATGGGGRLERLAVPLHDPRPARRHSSKLRAAGHHRPSKWRSGDRNGPDVVRRGSRARVAATAESVASSTAGSVELRSGRAYVVVRIPRLAARW